jgi:hypothetical protein
VIAPPWAPSGRLINPYGVAARNAGVTLSRNSSRERLISYAGIRS